MILSSACSSEAEFFEGYAWIGTDLIVGYKGAEKYKSERSTSIPPGEDGCYVTAQRTATGWEVGTDYRGLARLFLYRSGRNWAVSTSLYEIIKFTRSQGWTLSLLDDTLATYLNRGGFTAQLSSFDAHYEQIELLPSFASLKIVGKNIKIEYRPAPPVKEYATALSDFVGTWKSRFATLSSFEQGFVKFDLSGGIDSRTVLAFALANDQSLNPGTKTKVVSSKEASQSEDLRVAHEIAVKYGFEVNSQLRLPRPNRIGFEAISDWKKHSLGVYSPVYLYDAQLTPELTHAHGAGGGNFRPTYRSIERKIKASQKYISEQDFQRWKSRVEDSVAILTTLRPDVSAELLHYREFRNRFHFGHRPHNSLVFMPLESKLTDQVTDRADDRDGRQIYFDVMESLRPGLMNIRYDKEEKHPSAGNLEQLTKVDPTPLSPGTVFWIEGEDSKTRERIAPARIFDSWIEVGAKLLNEKEVRRLMPEEYLQAAAQAVGEWRWQSIKPRSNSMGMVGLSHAYTIALLTGAVSDI